MILYNQLLKWVYIFYILLRKYLTTYQVIVILKTDLVQHPICGNDPENTCDTMDLWSVNTYGVE